MTNKTKILSFALLLSCSTVFCQGGISFAKITIEAATQRANIEDKNIFVDAYAPWCGPCKIMDVHFKDKEVQNYFNRNFINVKIDTDTKYGKVVSGKYGIAFLPTILILDKDGRTRFKVDKLITKDELMSLAKYAMDGPKYPTPTAPTVSATPPPAKNTSVPKTQKKREPNAEARKEIEKKKVETTEVEDDNEKILYVLDPNATNLPPEILYEESYFRMQLNDGSHKETAAKYLETQDDWFTEKNIKFIFDFLYNTDSKEFDFFIANKSAFEKYIEQEKIERSLKFLIENKLYQGIPRPTFEQSKNLLSILDNENAAKNNYHYFLNRLFDEGKDDDFNSKANEYFKKYEKYNQEITIKYVSKKLETTTQKNKVKSLANLLNSIDTPNEDFNLMLCNAKLYLSLSDKTNALNYANKAINLAKEEKLDSSQATQILETIKEL